MVDMITNSLRTKDDIIALQNIYETIKSFVRGYMNGANVKMLTERVFYCMYERLKTEKNQHVIDFFIGKLMLLYGESQTMIEI